jgi:hypothetical protein
VCQFGCSWRGQVCSSPDHSKWFQVWCLCGEYFLDIDAKCGSIEDAWRVFNKMPSRAVVTWTAIFGGCVMHWYGKEALKHFELYGQMILLLFVFCQLVAMQVKW